MKIIKIKHEEFCLKELSPSLDIIVYNYNGADELNYGDPYQFKNIYAIFNKSNDAFTTYNGHKLNTPLIEFFKNEMNIYLNELIIQNIIE